VLFCAYGTMPLHDCHHTRERHNMASNTLVDVPGFRIGHATDEQGITGCTVIICPPGTVGGVDVRGGAPGTRETDLLQPHNHVEEVTAVLLSGGSAFGLAAAQGVVQYLEAQGLGYRSGAGYLVPIVPAAILFDLNIGDQSVRPDPVMGYHACENASTNQVEQGSIGAGTGAVVGKLRGMENATKGGLGSASMEIVDGLWVAAIVAVNAIGEVLDAQGNILAGIRDGAGGYIPALNVLREYAPSGLAKGRGESTVIAAIATNANLSKARVSKIAQMAHDGLARAIRPAHTMHDGDTIFALASGEVPADATVIGAFAAEMMAQAIRNAILSATARGGIPAVRGFA